MTVSHDNYTQRVIQRFAVILIALIRRRLTVIYVQVQNRFLHSRSHQTGHEPRTTCDLSSFVGVDKNLKAR